jgi:hypothetical protein
MAKWLIIKLLKRGLRQKATKTRGILVGLLKKALRHFDELSANKLNFKP